MNLFAIFRAVLFGFEAVADALNPKRKKETKREQRRFLFWYFLIFFLAGTIVAWTICTIYFLK